MFAHMSACVLGRVRGRRHFPPATTAAAHRVRWVPYLPAQAWTLTLLALEPWSHDGRLDPALWEAAPFSLCMVRVNAFTFGVLRPEDPWRPCELHQSRRMLCPKAGWSCLELAVGAVHASGERP